MKQFARMRIIIEGTPEQVKKLASDMGVDTERYECQVSGFIPDNYGSNRGQVVMDICPIRKGA